MCLFSVGCHLLLCCFSLFVGDSGLLLHVSASIDFSLCEVLVPGAVSLFVVYNIVYIMFLDCCGCNVSWYSMCLGCCAFCLGCDACCLMLLNGDNT